MTPRGGGHERVYRWLLRLYPAEFRARFADEMVQLFGDQLSDARTAGAPAAAASTGLRNLGDLVITAASEHTRRDRTVAHSIATSSPSTSSRVLGLAGISGGVVLLAAFVIDIAPGLNIWRLVLFNAGAMAIVVGVHRRQASVSPRLALAAVAAAVLANAWYLVMIVLSTGRPQPPQGDPDFRLVGFFAGLAMWLADAAFGLVTARLGMVTRWGAFALAFGSVLAITGMDRLELTSAADPTIFGPLSQVGIVLNGIGWILLGLDMATRRRPSETQPQGAGPGG